MNLNFNVKCFDIVDSTINIAKKYLLDIKSLDNNIAFIAEEQTNGIGKQGLKWESLKGNLFLSIVFKSFENYNWNFQEDINIFNLLSSLSLYQTIKKLINSNNKIFCKWPNDIIINESKVSGILLEKVILSDEETVLIDSFGVNLKHAPRVEKYNTISLSRISLLMDCISNIDFALILIKNILINAEKNKNEIIDLWLKCAYKVNERIYLQVANQKRSGIFRGINSKGFLLLEDNSKIKEISIGEVY